MYQDIWLSKLVIYCQKHAVQDVRSTCQGLGLGLHIEVFNVSKTATTEYENQKEDIDTQHSSLKMSLGRGGKENLKFWLLTPREQSCGWAVVWEWIVKHTDGFLLLGQRIQIRWRATASFQRLISSKGTAHQNVTQENNKYDQTISFGSLSESWEATWTSWSWNKDVCVNIKTH